MKKKLLYFLAFGLGFQSFAQITYTDIADVTLTPTATRESLDIDLNNDGTVDYTIFALDTTINMGANLPVKGIAVDMKGNSMVDGTNNNLGTGQVISAKAHVSGNDINSSLQYLNTSTGTYLFPGAALAVKYSAGSHGEFSGGVDQFIAVKFEISGSVHYGWIRVAVADNSANVIIKDFAYASTANAEIKAGDDGNSTSIKSNSLDNAKAFYSNNSLNIDGIDGEYEVSIIDLLGKSIHNTKVNNKSNIVLNGVNNGIYLVKITKGNSVVTKKIYIK